MPIRRLLTPLAVLYRIGSIIDRGQRKRHTYRSRLFVISVGNIASGGTGKTQLVLRLVDYLQTRTPLIVLSRGYGRQRSESIIWRVGDPLPSPTAMGDEPTIIASVLKYGAIGVGVDRLSLLRRLESEYDNPVVLLDDGFQHHQIARDCDIVMVDQATTHGAIIPVGELREPFGSLRRANAIIVSTPDLVPFAEKWKGRDARVFSQSPSRIRLVDTEQIAVDLEGRPVVVVTGIARPERVLRTIEKLGVTIVAHRRFRDHVRYDDADVDDIIETIRVHRAVCAVTTLKDAVKLSRYSRLRDQLAIVDISLQLYDETEFWTFLDNMINDRQRNHVQ